MDQSVAPSTGEIAIVLENKRTICFFVIYLECTYSNRFCMINNREKFEVSSRTVMADQWFLWAGYYFKVRGGCGTFLEVSSVLVLAKQSAVFSGTILKVFFDFNFEKIPSVPLRKKYCFKRTRDYAHLGRTMDCLLNRLETDTRRQREEHWTKKSLVLLQRFFFMVTRFQLIWLDIFVERVNREEKSHVHWTNRYILEHEQRRKKVKTVFYVY